MRAPIDLKAALSALPGLLGRGSGPRLAAAPARSSLIEVADFGANPGGLQMNIHTPERLAADSPLVVVLHGCGQSAAAYDRGAGWTQLADRLGFVVLAPGQTPANNMNSCFNWFRPGDTARGQGEAASIRQMIAHAVETYAIDPARIYITGLSAGGAMTSVMLAAYPEVFAGGAIIAGLPYGAADSVTAALSAMRQPPAFSARAWGDKVRAATDHAGPWPTVSVWHGDADHTVGRTNADAIVAQWRDLHSAATSRSERVDGQARQTWRDAAGRIVVESYTIAGMGHGTPIDSRVCGASGAFILEAGISSSDRIARSWGLGDAAHVRRGTPVEAPSPAGPQPAVLNGWGVDPQAVIAKALRSAGLMR